MHEKNTETEKSFESTFQPETLALFHAQYCDPNHDVIELYEGEVARFSKLLFYGQAGNMILVHRAAVRNDELIHWMATYDLSSNESAIYDVSDQVVDDEFFMRSLDSPTRTITYEAKSRGEASMMAKLRLGRQVMEWTQGLNTYGVDERQLPTVT